MLLQVKVMFEHFDQGYVCMYIKSFVAIFYYIMLNIVFYAF